MPLQRPSTPAPTDPLLHPALLLLLTPLFARAVSNSTPFPHWDTDPLLSPIATGAIGPSGSLACDLLSLLGAALLLARTALRREPFHRPLTILTFIGATAVALWAFVLSPVPHYFGDLGHARIGAAWLAAMIGALALAHAARDPEARRTAAGLTLGFVALLALRGAEQVFVEHRATLDTYRANKAQFLAARGWSEGSAAALVYERRLEQPEATGWFGLANVYATFAAGILVASLPLALQAFATRRRALIAAALTLTACAATALWLANSKGGVIAAAAGLLALGVMALHSAVRPRLQRAIDRALPALLGLGVVLGPIALVTLRGLLGERLAERSLLFRAFYQLASARIIAVHPLLGVGPDGYQQAFLLAKPLICPEEVASPHCIPLDWLATLGAFGAAWVCALIWYALLAARAPASSSPPGGGAERGSASEVAEESVPPRDSRNVSTPLPPIPPAPLPLSRPAVRTTLLVPTLATLVGLFIDSPGILPESAAARLIGTALWTLTALAVAHLMDGSRWPRLALAAAALTFIAHAQIDVAASLPLSCALWSLPLALAAAPSLPSLSPAPLPPCPPARLTLLPALLSVALAACISLSTITAARRDLHLAAAATPLRPFADLREQLNSTAPPPSLPLLAAEATALLGSRVPPDPAAIDAALAMAERGVLPAAIAHLQAAHALDPADRAPLHEASRLVLRLAENYAVVEPKNPAAAATTAESATALLGLDPDHPDPSARAADWYWLASLLEHRADRFARPADLTAALAARRRVAALDPTNLGNALRLTRLAARLGTDPALTRTWATRTLTLDAATHLDPLRSLPPADRAEMERLAN
jgi:hypothetical protein